MVNNFPKKLVYELKLSQATIRKGIDMSSTDSSDVLKILAASYPVFFNNERNSGIPFILELLNNEDLNSDSDDSEEEEEVVNKRFKVEKESEDENEEGVSRNVASGIKEARNYFDLIATYPDVDFVQHFRLQKSTVDYIIENIPEETKPTGRPRMPFEKQVLMTLWYLGNQEPLRVIAERFEIAISTLRDCIYRVCQGLVDHRHKFIAWPSEQKCYESMDTFERLTGFPGVVGCIDATHIPIYTLSGNKQNYSKKSIHTIILQAVCDERRMFIDVQCGWPGHISVAEAFGNSDVFQTMTDNPTSMFPSDSHLLGDSEYPLSQHLMTPFIDNGNSAQELIQYNVVHSNVRSHIEDAFALLKGRCRMLQSVHVINTAMIPLLVLGCCIIHNIATQFDDNDGVDNIEIESPPESNKPKVMVLCSATGTNAVAKRNRICTEISQNYEM